MGKRITDKVTWVGKVDWELRHFHGDEYETHKGSSYNSFLIKDEKTVLIDTVWKPYDDEFVRNLKKTVDLKEIDYIVCLHGEVDHTGSLNALMSEIPDVPIYCTANGVKSIKGQYHKDWDFNVVKTGDTLELGESTLTFVETPMLHWPDTMMAYLDSEKIFFSSDGFGQHMASESLFADTVDYCQLEYELIKYYANILAPFSPMVSRKVKEIIDMELEIDIICTAHGLMWRKNKDEKTSPQAVIEKYLEFADNYQENQITILYDSMWDNTRKMAEAIGQGLYEADPEAEVKILSISKNDKSDLLTEVFRSRAVLVGSSTENNGYLYGVSGILGMIVGSKLKKKKGAAFGSYGWSGEAVKLINEQLQKAGIEVVDEGVRVNWTPDGEKLTELRQYGRDLAKKLKA